MQDANEQTFSYAARYPWSRLPALMLTVAWVVILLSLAPRQWSRGLAEQAIYWPLAAFAVALTAWVWRVVLASFTEPRTISVTQRGITGRPTFGNAIEIPWDQIESEEQAHAFFLRRHRPRRHGKLEITRIRAYDGRVLVFKEDLPGYDELKRIVSDRLNLPDD